jgi:hypothetical protein
MTEIMNTYDPRRLKVTEPIETDLTCLPDLLISFHLRRLPLLLDNSESPLLLAYLCLGCFRGEGECVSPESKHPANQLMSYRNAEPRGRLAVGPESPSGHIRGADDQRGLPPSFGPMKQ